MKEIILKVLEDIASTSQINLQADSARTMIANALEQELAKYTNQLIEEIVVGIEEKKL